MDIVKRSRATSGVRREWLPRRKWINEKMLEDDIDEVAAAKAWEIAWESALEGQRSKCGKYS